MRDVIPLISLIEELNIVLDIPGQKQVVKFKVFEYNNGDLDWPRIPKCYLGPST